MKKSMLIICVAVGMPGLICADNLDQMAGSFASKFNTHEYGDLFSPRNQTMAARAMFALVIIPLAIKVGKKVAPTVGRGLSSVGQWSKRQITWLYDKITAKSIIRIVNDLKIIKAEEEGVAQEIKKLREEYSISPSLLEKTQALNNLHQVIASHAQLIGENIKVLEPASNKESDAAAPAPEEQDRDMRIARRAVRALDEFLDSDVSWQRGATQELIRSFEQMKKAEMILSNDLQKFTFGGRGTEDERKQLEILNEGTQNYIMSIDEVIKKLKR